MLDQLDTKLVCVPLELLYGPGPEGVAGCHYTGDPALLQAPGYLGDGRGLAHHAGQALGPARSGQHAEGDLRQADGAAALARDAQVAGHGELEAAADGVAAQGRDDELGGLLQGREGLVLESLQSFPDQISSLSFFSGRAH